jgi:uncharacterized protein YutE (UPF0331/DUF86 family)
MRALSHLTELEESLKDWERYQRYSLEELQKDRDKRNMVLHAMLISIQAAIDISSHLISKNQLKWQTTHRETFELLGRAGMISEELAGELSDLAGLRNVLVHSCSYSPEMGEPLGFDIYSYRSERCDEILPSS